MNFKDIGLWERIFGWKSLCEEIEFEMELLRSQNRVHEQQLENHKEQLEAHVEELEKAKAGNRTALKFIMQTNGLKLKLVILFLSITIPCMAQFPPPFIHNPLDTNFLGTAPASGWFLGWTNKPAWSINAGSLTNLNLINATNNDTIVSNGITARIIKSLGITVDGGGAVLTAGTKGYIEVPYDCTIISATLMADQSGSIAIETWRTNGVVASFPPTRAGVLFTNYLTTASKSTDFSFANNTSLSLQTTNVLGFNIITNALSITRVTLQLRVQP